MNGDLTDEQVERLTEPPYNRELLDVIDRILEEAREAQGRERFSALRKIVLITARTGNEYGAFVEKYRSVLAPQTSDFEPLDWYPEREASRFLHSDIWEHVAELRGRLRALAQRFSILTEKILTEIQPTLVDGEARLGAAEPLRRLHHVLRRAGETFSNTEEGQESPTAYTLNLIPLKIDAVDFDEKVYLDFFEDHGIASGDDRRFAFDYFDPDAQGGERPIRTSVYDVFLTRFRQTKLLNRVYLDERRIVERVGGRFDIHSDEDLRRYVRERFRPGAGADGSLTALKRAVDFLQRYLRAFTVSTPYDAVDPNASPSKNYLTRSYPRALTGQRVHDCGVYALRVANAVVPFARARNWRLRFFRSPFHVDVVLTRRMGKKGPSELPLLFNNSRLLYGDPRLFTDREPSMQEQYRRWVPKGRADSVEQFLADLIVGNHYNTWYPDIEGRTVGLQGTGTATPYRFATVNVGSGDPTERLWKRFTDPEVDRGLFKQRAKDVSLSFLLDRRRRQRFLNEEFYHFWNVDLVEAVTAFENAAKSESVMEFWNRIKGSFEERIETEYSDIQKRLSDAVGDKIAKNGIVGGKAVATQSEAVRTNPRTYVAEPNRVERPWGWASDLAVWLKKVAGTIFLKDRPDQDPVTWLRKLIRLVVFKDAPDRVPLYYPKDF